MRKPLLLLLLPTLLLTATPSVAHAEQIVRTPFTLQGSVAYACYGCGDTATFSGVMTTAGDNGAVTVPTTGELYVDETCGDTGSFYGTLHTGAGDYEVYANRYASAIATTIFGPDGFYDVYLGGGTLTRDSGYGCGTGPATASLTAASVPSVNCYCSVAGDAS
jgi:hypothetical protein